MAMRAAEAGAGRGGSTWRERLALALLHPATAGLPPKSWAVAQRAAEIVEACRRGAAERVTFTAPTAGAPPLDALWVRPGGAAADAMLVVVMGNAMTYEGVFSEAAALAEVFGLQILLYNSRGVGRSLGRPARPAEAVDDCLGALGWARGRAARVGLYGISLGAAWALLAAQAAAARPAGGGPGAGLALLALVRAFASPAAVVAAHLGGRAGAWAGRALGAVGFGPLDLAAALARPVAARRLLLTEARVDRLVPRAASLPRALGLAPDALGPLPSGQPALFVANHGAHHLDRDLRAPGHDRCLVELAAGP